GVGTARVGRRTKLGGGPAEARRGRRLQHSVVRDEGTARLIVTMALDLAQRQHGADAGVTALERAFPLGARARADRLRERLPQLRPSLAVMLLGQALVGQPQALDELRIKALLDCTHREPLAILGLVD